MPVESNTPVISQSEQNRRRKLIDEFGKLEPLAKRFDVLKREIRGWAVLHPADQDVCFEGREFIAAVSKCGTTRRICDYAKLLLHCGKEKFLSIARVTLKDAEEALTPSQFAEVVQEEPYAGERSVKVLRRTLAKAA